MALSDYLKKKEEQVTPPVTPSSPSEEIAAAMPVTNIVKAATIPTVSSRISGGEDPLSVILDNNYKESKESIERQRKADFFGQIAKVAAQTGANLAGARQFKPVESNTQSYTAALDRLRDNYNSTRLNLSLAEQKKKIDQKRWEYEQAMKAKEAEVKAKQWQAGHNLELDKHALEKIYKTGKLGQGSDLIAETGRHNKVIEGIGKTNAAIAARNATSNEKKADAAAIAAASAGKKNTGSDSNMRSIVVTNEKGERVSVNYPKTKDGSIISLYNRMRALAGDKPNRDIDDIKLQFGEGGDQYTKALTIIQRRLQDFPELTDEFYSIINSDNGPKTIYGFGSGNKKTIDGF